MKRSSPVLAGFFAAFAGTSAHATNIDFPALDFPQGGDKTAAVATEAEPAVIEAESATEIVTSEPVAGGSPIKGFVEGSFGFGRGSNGTLESEITGWALRGSINTPVRNKLNFQFDAAYNGTSSDAEDSSTLSGTAHAYMRLSGAFAAGAFVHVAGFTSDTLDAMAAFGFDDYATDVLAGGEAAVYTEHATFYAQAGLGQFAYSGASGDHALAAIGARIYANDNLRFDVEGSFNEISTPSADVTNFGLTAAANHRLTAQPFTVFGGYRFDRIATDTASASVADVDTHTVFGGVRYHFGSASMKDEERNGPAWSAVAVKL